MSVYATLLGASNPPLIAGKSTWANRPAASLTNGLTWLMTDIGKGALFISDGTDYFPVNGVAKGGGSNVPAVLTGTTNKTTLYSATIPAGLMGTNGALRVRMQWSSSNTAGNKNPIVSLGSTDFWTPTGASFLSAFAYMEIANMNSASSQLGSVKSFMSMLGATTTSVGQTGTENTANALNLVVSAQLASGSDTITLQRVSWELVK